VSHLEQSDLGAVTGYRWFTPARPTVANALVYSMNCDVMSLLTRSSHYLVWGGSWAIRRELFDSLELRALWQGTLSDDLVASRELRRAGLRVLFEPACLVTSPADVTLSGLLEFVRRQYLMGRLYVPRGWAFALLMTSFVNAASVANVGVLAGALAMGLVESWIPATFCAVLYVLSMVGGLLRQDLALSYFPHLQKTLRKARRFEIWTGPLVALVNWMSMLGSTAGRHLRWRGIAYAVGPDGKVTATDRLGAAAWRSASKPEERSLPEDRSEPVVIPMPSIRVRSATRSPAEKSQRRCA
jgi:ceramide glucosyltransferase